MVIALGKAGFLGSFGAAGLPPARLEAAIQQIQAALPDGPYAFNLIHSPHEEAWNAGPWSCTCSTACRWLRLLPSSILPRILSITARPACRAADGQRADRQPHYRQNLAARGGGEVYAACAG
jgi:hypothetical protein